MEIGQQIIVQKGRMSCKMMDKKHKQKSYAKEEWICLPKRVDGTAAHDLLPVLQDAFPSELDPHSLGEIEKFLEYVDSATIIEEALRLVAADLRDVATVGGNNGGGTTMWE